MRTLPALLLCVALAQPLAVGAAVEHPLDPLSWQEYWTVIESLQAAGHLDPATRFSQVRLIEPDKASVWKWTPGKPVPGRRAYAALRTSEGAFEAEVDLSSGKLLAWEPLEGAHISWVGSEYGAGIEQALSHPEFLAALAQRGYDDPTLLDCATIPPGYFGTPEEQGRRLGHVRCSDPRGVRNTWSRQLADLTAVVDVDSGEVLEVVDEGVVPVPESTWDYNIDGSPDVREVPGPFIVQQPQGPGFVRDGNVIRWQHWSFHVRLDQREGPIVSLVRYRDGDRNRTVLYQGHLSEIFVPYMDPGFAWHARNFIDSGEFSSTGLFKPLLRDRDCPPHAHYMNSLTVTENGQPHSDLDTLCIFERDIGDPAWRHVEDDHSASRPRRDLVLRSAAVIGNYDYLLDWVFRQDGSIEIAVGATGIVEVKSASSEGAGTGEDAWGHFVAPHIIGVNHDHYFSFRLDLDVDGPENSLVIDRLVQQRLDSDRRKSIWVTQSKTAANESDGQLNINLKRPAMWRVTSKDSRNAVDYPTSFQIKPGSNAEHLLSDDDYAHLRAGFIDHHLWVTPYRPEERYAAGEHPTLSEPGMGLPAWTQANRPVEDTDIVLWHTVGMHHVVRAEDWPVMPVLWKRFELRPFDFFDGNPALDLPPER